MSYNYKNSKLAFIVKNALREDLGKRDITTELIIRQDKFIKTVLLAKEECVVCGLSIAELVFKLKDKSIHFKSLVKDGQKIKKGKILARIWGNAKSILTAERVALNFLSLLSGIATKTRKYVEETKPYKVKVMDTRKTIPGLRDLEKYAVRVGGGCNHRFRLDEMVLIKDNHLKVINGYQRLPKTAKGYKLEVEVKNLNEFKKILKLEPDIIMLDNMSIRDIKKAVRIRDKLKPSTNNPIPKLEASGGINLKIINKIASSGIDMISIGDLTHSVKSVDISLEVL